MEKTKTQHNELEVVDRGIAHSNVVMNAIGSDDSQGGPRADEHSHEHLLCIYIYIYIKRKFDLLER